MTPALAMIALVFQSPANEPVNLAQLEKVLNVLAEFTSEQGDLDHAQRTAEMCKGMIDTGDFKKAMRDTSARNSWSKLDFDAMMHDCYVFTAGKLSGAAEQIAKQATADEKRPKE